MGMEVILDVVYNHTAEMDAGGPVVSYRALADEEYYMHDARGVRTVCTLRSALLLPPPLLPPLPPLLLLPPPLTIATPTDLPRARANSTI